MSVPTATFLSSLVWKPCAVSEKVLDILGCMVINFILGLSGALGCILCRLRLLGRMEGGMVSEDGLSNPCKRVTDGLRGVLVVSRALLTTCQ